MELRAWPPRAGTHKVPPNVRVFFQISDGYDHGPISIFLEVGASQIGRIPRIENGTKFGPFSGTKNGGVFRPPLRNFSSEAENQAKKLVRILGYKWSRFPTPEFRCLRLAGVDFEILRL